MRICVSSWWYGNHRKLNGSRHWPDTWEQTMNHTNNRHWLHILAILTLSKTAKACISCSWSCDAWPLCKHVARRCIAIIFLTKKSKISEVTSQQPHVATKLSCSPQPDLPALGWFKYTHYTSDHFPLFEWSVDLCFASFSKFFSATINIRSILQLHCQKQKDTSFITHTVYQWRHQSICEQ